MTIKNKTACIIGAGITGCSIARLLADNDYQVILYERDSEIGGACADFLNLKDNSYRQLHGSHIFHTNNKRVWDFLSEHTDWSPYQHKVKALINGDLVPIPFNLNSIKIFPEDFQSAIKEDLKLFDYEDTKEFNLGRLMSHSSDTLRKLGFAIKKYVFEGYSIKQWGQMPDKDVINRVKAFRNSTDDRYFLDKYQGIPSKGFSTMMKQMTTHKNIQLKLGDTKDLDLLKTHALVIYTGAIDELFDYQLGKLPYRTCNFISTYRKATHAQELAVVNYPNDYGFTRSHDYSHYLPGTVSCIEYEYPSDFKGFSPRYYPIETPENRNLYMEYRKLAVKELPNAIFAGRLGTYKYLNMDKAIEQAFDIVEQILNK